MQSLPNLDLIDFQEISKTNHVDILKGMGMGVGVGADTHLKVVWSGHTAMGVATGGGGGMAGTCPPGSEFWEDVPHRNRDFLREISEYVPKVLDFSVFSK